MPLELRPASDNLLFMSPLSSSRADGLAAFLAVDGCESVIDFGCGWAELLLRTAALRPGCRAIGIDGDAPSIELGRRRAHRRGLVPGVELEVGDAAAVDVPAPGFAAAICIGASQIWRRPDDRSERMDYGAALRALRSSVRPGARVVYGEGIWSRPPTPEAIAPLGGVVDEFVTIGELVDLAVEHGFAPMAVGEASLAEWDEFESGYTARYAAWLADHDADDPDAADVRARAARQRKAYYGGYRGVLGLAYLSLLAV